MSPEPSFQIRNMAVPVADFYDAHSKQAVGLSARSRFTQVDDRKVTGFDLRQKGALPHEAGP